MTGGLLKEQFGDIGDDTVIILKYYCNSLKIVFDERFTESNYVTIR